MAALPQQLASLPAPADPRRWRALAVCLVAGFMALLDVTIVNVALPSIETGLGARTEDLQWVVAGYALALGVVLGIAGRVGDARGRRRVFLAGVATFTLASVASGLAPNAGVLIATRALQGLGGGVLMPQVSGLIQQLFHGAERGRAFGLFGAMVGIATAVGPTLGGVLIHFGGPEHGWRWIFFVNLPIGVLALLLGSRLIPAGGPPRTAGQRLDLVGMVLLGAGVLLILTPLIENQVWPAWQVWSVSIAGAAVLGVFWWWERRYARTGEPVVDVTLFRRRSYALGSLLALCYFGGFSAVFFTISLLLQQGLGYSALVTGLVLTPFAVGSAVAAGIGGRLVDRFGRPLVAVGLVMVALGIGAVTVAVGLADGPAVGWAMAAPLLLAGLGSGLVITPNVTLTLSQVPVPKAGSAGGVLQTAQRVGAAAGIALIGAVLFAQVAATGDWPTAARHALLVTVALMGAALVVAVVDIGASARRGLPGSLHPDQQ
ncbi:MFS transporter [Natronosporangium hydrolyticum]|uniref:MFS transporter n=1 Tax=Natronosporangium hydrolyticum TaxID=2811111 RepID=A0A895YEI7_9ACTN|nr:MFS transporter [Natronosporangium hydrolyticum]QSB13843.1 MFS transporter [Natronosporangium hydrolyticum]